MTKVIGPRAAKIDELLAIPDELLETATEEELDAYEKALQIEKLLYTPGDYGVSCGDMELFPHTELMNDYVTALMDGHLYFDGPGPLPVALREDQEPIESVAGLVADYQDGEAFDEDGYRILVHPERGDRPVYSLALSMPPRHGKSMMVSEFLPAWFLTNFPDYSVLLAAYEADFAAEWGEKVRDHLCDNEKLTGIKVQGGRGAARKRFTLAKHRGVMKTAGAGGPLTGSGGHLMICDDPIKNSEEAMSQADRDTKGNWWSTTFWTRRQMWDDGTPCRVILMATRWHEDDINGRVVPDELGPGDRWCRLNLMALFEPTDDTPVDPMGREPGQALCPQLMPKDELVATREAVGDLWFTAMYQGYPSIAEGTIIRRPFNYYTLDDGVYTLTFESGEVEHIREDDCFRFATLDLAASVKTWADWTVMIVADISRSDPRHLMIRHRYRIRMETDDHLIKAKEWSERWGVKFLAVEDKTYGTNLLQLLRHDSDMRTMALKADKDKIFRAKPVAQSIGEQRVWFPKRAEWLKEFEEELLKFPNTKHDDQVDALAYAVQEFNEMPPYILRPQEDTSAASRIRRNIERKIKTRDRARKGRSRQGW